MSSPTPPSAARLLTWVEPRGFRQAEWRAAWKSTLRLIGLTAIATLLFMGASMWLGGPELVWKLLLAGVALILLCLVVFLAVIHTRITIRVTGHAIVWALGETETAYPFPRIDHCAVIGPRPDRAVPYLLEVTLRNGDQETFAMPSSIPHQILRSTLEANGVAIVFKAPATTVRNPAAPDPFNDLIRDLGRDGLAAESSQIDQILHHTAWTTGSELLGALGLALQRLWPMVKGHCSTRTKNDFKRSAKLIRAAWRPFRL